MQHLEQCIFMRANRTPYSLSFPAIIALSLGEAPRELHIHRRNPLRTHIDYNDLIPTPTPAINHPSNELPGQDVS